MYLDSSGQKNHDWKHLNIQDAASTWIKIRGGTERRVLIQNLKAVSIFLAFLQSLTSYVHKNTKLKLSWAQVF